MNVDEAQRVWSQVVLLNCGGTINMSGGSTARPGDGVAQLFERLGAGFDRHRLTLRSPFARPPDSSAVGRKEWAVLLAEIREVDGQRREAERVLRAAGRDPGSRGGIVVAHGTDTMQVTSMVTALEVARGGLASPVVFTGSWCPPSQPESDALGNLAKAVFAATLREELRPHNLPPGVYVLLGEDIHLASRISKVGSVPNSDGRYFFSFPGPIAQMTSKDFSVKLDQGLLDRVSQQDATLSAPTRTGPWGEVEHLVLDAFVDCGVVEDLAARLSRARASGVRTGVVVQGDFSRHPAVESLVTELRALARQGVVVVLGSKRASRLLHAAGPCPGVVLLPRALSHGTARTKLSWLLGTAASSAEIGTLMETSLVGEVFETASLPSWIKYETFPDQHPGTLVVPAWPDLPAEVVRAASARVREHKRATLHLFGFGYGHLPGPNQPLDSLARAWLSKHLPTLELAPVAEPGADAVVACLVNALGTCDRDTLSAWAEERYAVHTRAFHSALRRRVSARLQRSLRAAVGEEVRQVVGRLAAEQSATVKPRRLEAGIAALVGELRFGLESGRLDQEQTAVLAEAGVPAPAGVWTRCLAVAPEILARRLLKDAVMAAHPLLAAVGDAVDQGVRVEIHSLAARSWSNVAKYEAGTLLLALGVRAEQGPWWAAEGVVPRRKREGPATA